MISFKHNINALFLISITLMSIFNFNAFPEIQSKNVIFPSGDTVQPPPNHPDSINGPATSCTEDTSIYQADIPVSCTAMWYLNNILQQSTADTLQIIWQEAGTYTISLYFDCNGNILFFDSLTVVTGIPPEVNLGNDTVINQGESIVLDAGNEGSTYLWSTGDTTQTISVSETGYYSVLVTNSCGSDSDTVFVDVYDFINKRHKDNSFKIISKGNRIVIWSEKRTLNHVIISGLDGKIFYNGNYKTEYTLSGKKRLYIIKVIFSDSSNAVRLFFK